MAGERGRIAQAFIEVHAKDAGVHGDVEKIGKEYGRKAGKSAGQEFQREFDKEVKGSKGKRVAEGRQVGAEIGAAAGAEAGKRTSEGISGKLKRDRGKRRQDGEAIGEALGVGAGRTFSSRFIAAGQRAGRVLEGDLAKRLGKGIKVGIIGTGAISLLATAASGLSSVLAGAATAAFTLSGALGILPAVLVAGGIAAGVLKLGLYGVSDAIKNSSDPEAYAKAMEALAPAAQKFVRALVGAKPAAKALRDSVQNGLFRGLDKDVIRLSTVYLPVLKNRLTDIAKSFNLGAKDVASFFAAPAQVGSVARILDLTAVSADKLKDSLRPLAGALLDIVEVGAQFLPSGAEKLANAALRFSTYISALKASGGLGQFFREGIEAVGDLGDALKGGARIIGGIFAAGNSADSAPLETLATLLNSIADTINQPAFQTGLSHFFDAVASAGAGLGEKMGELGTALVALEPTISRIVSGSGVAFPSILHSISSAAISLAPLLNLLGAAFEALAPHAGPLVIALLGIKGAMLAMSIVGKVVAGLTLVQGAILTLGSMAVVARLRLLAFSGMLRGVGLAAIAARVEVLACTSALGLLGPAAAVIGVAVGARALGDFIGKAQVATVSVDGLAGSLQSLGSGGGLGKTGLELFSEGMGPFKKEAESTSEALKRFGIDAHDALDQGWEARIERMSSFGQSEAEFRKETQQLDGAFSKLAENGHLDTASVAFLKFAKAGEDAGVPVASLKAAFPQFTAAVEAAGGTVDKFTGAVTTSGFSVDSTTGKVKTLSMSIAELILKTDEYANKTLTANDAARGYEAALDAARDAAKRNGNSLAITTEKGRENSAALDAIAASGIALAKQMAGDGPNAQARFRSALVRTRRDLVAAGQRFGLSERAAKRYADRILRIPSKASTRVATPGLDAAIARMGDLIVQTNRINGRVYTFTIRQVYESIGRQDAAMARRGGRMAGGFVDRKAAGGLIDPRLGAPRQDNVPLLVSGGEFVVNQYATSQPGVLALLRAINAQNQIPKFASGGQVARASAGLNDLTAGKSGRIERIMTANRPAEAPDMTNFASLVATAVADATAKAVRTATRDLTVRLDDGTIAGAVYAAGGRL